MKKLYIRFSCVVGLVCLMLTDVASGALAVTMTGGNYNSSANNSGGNPAGTGAGTLEDVALSVVRPFTYRVDASGLVQNPVADRAVIAVNSGNQLLLNIAQDGNAPAVNSALRSVTYNFGFGDGVNGIRIFGADAQASDFVNWQISWSGAVSTNGLLTNTPGADRGLFAGAAKLANGNFSTGTTFRFDDDGIPNQGIGGAVGPYQIALPNRLTNLTITQTWNPNQLDLDNEFVLVDFSQATAVPEPTFFGLLSLVGVAGVSVRRRSSIA